ncbi:MAG: glycosyltransferase [Gaiellaceae bacterium]
MTGAAPDVSVIVVAHDVRDEVLACLESVARHAAPATHELLLVDNGSSDGTAEAVAEAFPETQVVRLPRNVGVAARNEGLRRARGRMRMFLDSDARLTAGALPGLVAYLDANPGVGLVGPKLVYEDGTLQLSARRFPPPLLPLVRRPPLGRFFEDGALVRRHLMADERHDRTREVEYVLGACQLFTARAQSLAGEIDARIFFGPDDADWCFRIRRVGLAIVYHPAATVVHAYRRTSAARPLSRIAFEQLRAFARFQWKWRRERARLLREGREMDARAGGGQSALPE